MAFRLQGLDQMKHNLRRVGANVVAQIPPVLRVEAEEIITISKRDHVPQDLGPLRSSGKTNDVERIGRLYRVSFQFGDTSAPYALTVHEHPSPHDPPSWQGKRVVFNPSGRGPKYLEIPLNERVIGMARRIANELKL